MEKRVLAHGISTAVALCAASKEILRDVWGGIEGERMYQSPRGETVYEPPTRKSTVGHSHVLPPEERNPAATFGVLNRLLQKAAMRLRKMRYCAGAMHLSMKYTGHTKWSDKCTFMETQDTVEFLRILRMLWERRPADGSPMAVGVTLFHLVEEQNRTPSLFEKGNTRRDLNAMVDLLNDCYGKNTVYFAGAHNSRKSAPMRIAFNYVPDLKSDAD